MENQKISVVIPIYNVELYIERCAKSLFEQTHKNIEYIFVNDCSPDKSIELLKNVLEEFPHRKVQTRIIEMPQNVGVSAVRKHAVSECTGNYIIHIDSDDYIDSNYFETLLRCAISNDADIVISDIIKEYGSHRLKISLEPTQNKDEILSAIIRGKNSYMCNKLIRTEIAVKALEFLKEGFNVNEDYASLVPIFAAANVIAFSKDSYYHYFQQNTSSITKNISRNFITSSVYYINRIEEFIHKNLGSAHNTDISYRKMMLRYTAMYATKGALQKEYSKLYPEINKESFKLLKLTDKLFDKVVYLSVIKSNTLLFNLCISLKRLRRLK